MDILLLAQVAVRSLRRDGMRVTVGRVVQSFKRSTSFDEFDLKNGTNTAKSDSLWKFRIASVNRRFGVRYQASDEQGLVDAVRFLGINPSDFCFIDLGCGKGKSLIVASRVGFRETISVEFAKELVQIARQNIKLTQITNATITHGDAAEYIFVPQPTVIFMFNPFGPEVMRKVVENMRGFCSMLYVVYVYPAAAQVLSSSGFLRDLGCLPARPDIHLWSNFPIE